MKSYLTSIILALINIVWILNLNVVYADSIDIMINGLPDNGEISGIDQGNNLSFDVLFSLEQIPSQAEILSASLEYSQTNTSSGLIRLIDKYSTNVIDVKLLSEESELSINNILVYATQWHKKPSTNFGILIQGAALQNTDKILLNNLVLNISYTLPDTVSPIIIEVKSEDILSQSAKVKVLTDEETKIKINYGRTSLYGSSITSDIDIFATEHTLTFSDLIGGQTYHYSVEATDRFNNTSKSSNATFETLLDFELNNNTPINFSLKPPANLKADTLNQEGFYSINLSWSPSTESGLKGYIVYRANDIDRTYREYKIIENQTSSITDDKVESNRIYYYYVRSFTINQISPRSTELAIEVKPIVDTKQTEPATLQTFLFTLALAAILLFSLYVVIRILTNIQQKDKKGLVNVLKDPDFYQ